MKNNNYDIIMVSHLLFTQAGGLEKMVLGLLKSFSKNGYKSVVIHGADKYDTYSKKHFDGISLNPIKLFDKTYPVFGFKYISKFIGLLLNNPTAVIIINDRHLTSSVLSAVLCKLLGRQYILIVHTTDSNFFKKKLLMRIGNMLDKLVFSQVVRSAAKVISVSETTKKYLFDKLNIDPKKVIIIYNCFDHKLINEIKLGESKEKMIVFCAKWIQVKNPDLAAKAFYYLAHKYPKWTFNFIGKGSSVAAKYKNELENLNVIEEFFPQEDLFALLSKSSIYVNSSQQEGLSLGIVEAAALGNIPVVSDAPSNKEIATTLNTKRLVFKRNDFFDIVEKIEKAIKISEESKVGNRRKRIIESAYKHFSDRKSHKKYLNFISRYSLIYSLRKVDDSKILLKI